MDYAKHIDLLIHISSAVEYYITNEMYTPKVEVIKNTDATGYAAPDTVEEIVDTTEISEKEIVNSCYEIILGELYDMGIIFHCDMNAILGNFYDAECIYFLRKLYDIENLYLRLSGNRRLKEELIEIITDCTDPTFKVLTCIRIILKYNKTDEELLRLDEFYSNKITNTNAFINYVTNIIYMIEGPEFEDINEVDDAMKLTEYIAHGKERALAIFEIALSIDPSLDAMKLYKDHRLYNMDKLQPHKINKYIFWLKYKEDPNVSQNIRDMAELYNHEHTVVTNHHIEYYRLKPSDYVVKKEDMLNLMANISDPGDGDSKAVVKEKLYQFYNELRDKYNIQDGTLELCLQVLDKLNWILTTPTDFEGD